MFTPFAFAILSLGALWAREPQPAPVTAARLPVLCHQLRDHGVSEAELRGLLETSLGSGVSVSSLVQALDVVVDELESGHGMPDLSLRLPGFIVQGLEGDQLASTLRQASSSARASVLAIPIPLPEPRREPEVTR
jgi:hypothetical protein